MGSYTDKTFDPTQKEILAVCDTREEALRTEMFFHEMYDVARNPTFANRAKATSTGFSREGTTHSEEAKQKMSEARIGKRHTEESKQKMSEARAGENHPMFGKKHSEETKQKISEAQIGKTLSEETKQKISEALTGENHPMFGKKYGEETLQKMREAHIGKTHSDKTRRKMREARIGKKWWVNSAGETVTKKESPGPDWQQGRKFKGERP
jgi:hypothetical protein